MEEQIILKSFKDTVYPKLIEEDGVILGSLIKSVFSGDKKAEDFDQKIVIEIKKHCVENSLVFEQVFVDKVLQFYQVM